MSGASSPATCRERRGCASPAAGGRATRTSTGYSPRSNTIPRLPVGSPAATATASARLRGRNVGRGAQPELRRDRPQRLGHERDVLVQIDAERLGALVDVVAVDARGERRL